MTETTWPPVPAGRSAWSVGARKRLAAILCATLPPEDVGADRAKVPDFVGAFAGSMPVWTRAGLRVLSEFIFWLGPLVFVFKPRRFDVLSQDDQERLLNRVAYSNVYQLRLLGTSVKALAGLGIVGDPGAREFLGIDPVTSPPPPIGGRVRWNEDITGFENPFANTSATGRDRHVDGGGEGDKTSTEPSPAS